MDFIYSREHNIALIGFHKIYRQAELSFINELHTYGLIQDCRVNLKNKDVKRLFLHTVIHTLCESIITSSAQCKKVVVFTEFTQDSAPELSEYCDLTQINKFVTKTLKDITKMLPIFVHFSKTKLNMSQLLDKRGESMEFFHELSSHVDGFTWRSGRSFSDIRKYTQENKLTFLSQEYFNNLYAKQLFYR